jgi:hypothetical protein
MPGGLILPRQRKILEELFKDTTLILSTKKSDHCSVNIHGHFYLCKKTWNDGQIPDDEVLLGLQGGETGTGEPLAHFHVTWADLHWMNIKEQRNSRIDTDYRVGLYREDKRTEEIYFYVKEGPIIKQLIANAKPAQEGWVRFVSDAPAVKDQNHWGELKDKYRKNGIALALGAGVSTGCDLPDWCELLRRIAIDFYGDKGQSLVNEMIAKGYPLPTIASMLEINRPRGKNFGEVIRDALYKKFGFYHKKVEKAAFVKYVEEHNKTLSAVADLCKSWDGKSANPLIHAIINSNYDATLREYTKAKYGKHILRTVERPSAGVIRGRINVYHVHGFFQFQDHLIGKQDEEAPDIRVFTEQEYFDFFNEPNSLFNYTFLYLLREYNVLFIGMSLMDENVRRLLHYSRKEIRESYRKEKVSRADAERKSVRHYSIQQLTWSKRVNKMIEKSLGGLGVRVLWIQEFSEIPERLKELYVSGQKHNGQMLTKSVQSGFG